MGSGSAKRRAGLLLLGVGAGAALAVAGPALGADQDVRISAFAFSPARVNVDPGETVTWRWAGPDTNHSVTARSGQEESFDSDPGRFPSSADHPPGDSFAHTFSRPGTFRYFCKVHPSMEGSVVVGGSPSEPPADGDAQAPVLRAFSVRPASVCTRRTRNCPRTRAVVRFRLSEAAALRVRILRGARTVRSFEARRSAGSRRLPLPTARLAPGRYRVELVATDAAGNASRAAAAGLRVRLPRSSRRASAAVRRARGGDYFLSPGAISIRRGGVVRWRWVGRARHNVTAVSGGSFASATKRSGTFAHRFRRAGTVRLVCTLHATSMRMVVRVRR